MRRALLVMLLPLSVCAVVLAAAAVYSAGSRVALTEQTVRGDRSAAAGLTLELAQTYRDRLIWRTTQTLGPAPSIETAYEFHSARHGEAEAETYRGISLSTLPSSSYLDTGEEETGSDTGIRAAFRELAEETEPGSTRFKQIRLKDYTGFYPIYATLDFPHARVYDIEGRAGTACRHNQALFRKLQQYFKIPVLEDERLGIHLEKDAAGVICSKGYSTGGEDRFDCSSVSVLTGDACYFTFDAHTREGKLVDLSCLPEGYGIYRLPYEEREEEGRLVSVTGADTLELVYPLEPAVRPQYLHTNPAQNELLLHTVENGNYIITVIDLASMETVQRLEVAKGSDHAILCGEGSLLVLLLPDGQGGRLAVLTAGEDGRYALRFVCPAEGLSLRFPCRPALAFDGERLAVAGRLEGSGLYGYENCNYFLTVYTFSGLQYYGEWRSSLDTGYDESNGAYHCRLYGDRPIRISWRSANTDGPTGL